MQIWQLYAFMRLDLTVCMQGLTTVPYKFQNFEDQLPDLCKERLVNFSLCLNLMDFELDGAKVINTKFVLSVFLAQND